MVWLGALLVVKLIEQLDGKLTATFELHDARASPAFSDAPLLLGEVLGDGEAAPAIMLPPPHALKAASEMIPTSRRW
ncbi:MAG: hypothetical protein NVSMB31_15460 [Vulcanimicrobiaceae bacterium]